MRTNCNPEDETMAEPLRLAGTPTVLRVTLISSCQSGILPRKPVVSIAEGNVELRANFAWKTVRLFVGCLHSRSVVFLSPCLLAQPPSADS